MLGGIEASLRRVAHYDYWEDKLRPSILVDSKADLLVYGMGERAIREIAGRLGAAAGTSGIAELSGIRGTARLLGANAAKSLPLDDTVVLPSLEELRATWGPAAGGHPARRGRAEPPLRPASLAVPRCARGGRRAPRRAA